MWADLCSGVALASHSVEPQVSLALRATQPVQGCRTPGKVEVKSTSWFVHPAWAGAVRSHPSLLWGKRGISVIIRSSLALGTAELAVFCMEACEFGRGIVLELHCNFTPNLLSESLPQT